MRFTIADIRYGGLLLRIVKKKNNLESTQVRKVSLPRKGSFCGVNARPSHIRKSMCKIFL